MLNTSLFTAFEKQPLRDRLFRTANSRMRRWWTVHPDRKACTRHVANVIAESSDPAMRMRPAQNQIELHYSLEYVL